MARQKPEKIYHVSVVGMSGMESERGATGVGKSCLCNRFLNPHQDKYFTDHISVISSSDFSGRIVNNDHFLYWGECTRKYDGDSMTFRVVEQTEFIDDSSFSPLRGSNTHTYFKRAAVTNLKSAEKVMYICKDQVGDETNFPQRILPDGKFPVDGFLIVYDVSRSAGHEKQLEWVTKLQGQLHKAKRPAVVVATKYDEAWEPYVRDAKTFATKIKAPLIETSSQEGVNVDLAFAMIASKIEKRSGPRELPFTSGNEARQKVITKAVDEYEQMLKQEVTNYHDLWTSRKKQYQHRDVFQKVVELIGTKNAKTYFTRHTQRLRTNHQQNKMKLYLGRLPDALENIFPDLNSIGGRDWTECREALPELENFEKWFIILPHDQTWRDSEYIDTEGLLIPYDLLEGNEKECENCFGDHVNRLNAAKRKERMKEDFKKLLESLPSIVLPARSMDDELVLDSIRNNESFSELDEDSKIAIYKIHQENITAKAKADFAELLMEKHALLAGVDITQQASKEVDKLKKQLESEPRWQKLSEMKLDRYVKLLTQLAFVQNPTTESCYYGEKCMEKLTQLCIERTVQKSPIKELGNWDDTNNKLNIIVMGEDGLADELDTEIKSQSFDGDYTLDKVLYSLDLRTIEGDITDPNNRLLTDSFTPQGCICVFTSLEGFQYVRDCLERTILSDQEEYNSSTLRDLAVVLMFGRSTSPEADTAQVREQAERLCSRLNNCQIVNVPPDNTTLWQGKKFSGGQIQDALRSVVAGQKYSSGTPNQTESDRGNKGDNAFRIGLCMPCGDPFQPDLVLSPITSHSCMATPNEKNSITCDMFLIDTKCRVDFEIASYHLGDSLREQRVHHGYILVYAAQRKASLELLRWFLKLVEPIPTLVVAVCEDINSAADGIAEGNRLVDDTATARLVTANCSSFRDQTVIYNRFLKEAYDKRKETESLFKVEEPPSPVLSNRPPMELPSPHRDGTLNDSQTPTSGVEDSMYDEINQPRWTPKPNNEDSSFHPSSPTKPKVKPKPPVRSSSRKQDYHSGASANTPAQEPEEISAYGEFSRPAPKPQPEPEEIAAYGEFSRPAPKPQPDPEEISPYGDFSPRPTSKAKAEPEEIPAYGEIDRSKKAAPKPDPRAVEEIPAYGEIDRSKKAARNPDPTDVEEIPAYGEIDRSKKVARKPDPAAVEEIPEYGVINKPATKKPAVAAGVPEDIYATVDKSKTKEDTKLVDDSSPMEDVYAVVDKQRKPFNQKPSPDEPAQDGGEAIYGVVNKNRDRKKDLGGRIVARPTADDDGFAGLYAEVNRGFRTSTPETNRSNEGSAIFGQHERWKLPGLASTEEANENNTLQEEAEFDKDGMVENILYDSYSNQRSPAPRQDDSMVYASVPGEDSRQSEYPEEGMQENPLYDAMPSPATPYEDRSRQEPPPTAPKPGNQRITYGKPMVALTPRPNRPTGLPVANDSITSDALNRSREVPKATPVKRSLGGVDARNKKKDEFLRGLNKLMEDSKDTQDEPNTPREDKKQKKTKEKVKKPEKNKGKYALPKKPTKPALEMLQLNENGVPPFIEQCVETIEAEGISQEGIYRVSGKAADIETIIKMFDEDQNADLNSLENLSANTIASALKQFFKNLPEPIIPYSTQDKMISDYKEVNSEDLFVERLPEYLLSLTPVKKGVLTFMMKHMKRITQFSEANLMTAENLSICWWPSMLHPQSKSFDDLANEALLAAVFKLIVEHSQRLFDFT